MFNPSPASASDAGKHPLADRRFAYAQAAFEDEAWHEAAELFEQTLEVAPDWVAAWIGLGEARGAQGDHRRAICAFRQALHIDPTDEQGVALRLAVHDPTATPIAAPPAYIGALFDAYATRFEAHLTGALAYRGPAILAAALAEAGRTAFAHAIDLGCGTGLGGVALRPFARRLTGVDLSARMVDAARGKAIYDRLIVGDIVPFLQGEPPASADLVLAADVFVYVGDLAAVFRAAARVLAPGGVIAFTAQRGPNGVTVGDDMRFAHSRAYVADALAASGYAVLVLRDEQARREKTCDVPGLVAVAALR